ncbi:MAG: MMPL family transporter [Magnetococcales bacterium]|nr:MMPL family transporter [Magnetococcales bacterium]
MTTTLARYVEHHFRFISVLTFLLLLVVIEPLAGLKVEHSFEGWIDRDGALFQTYREFTDAFGADDTVLVVFQLRDLLVTRPDDADSMYPRSYLDDYVDVVQSFARMEGVSGVMDPVEAWSRASGGLGGLDFFDPERLDANRENIQRQAPGSIGFLISRDLKTLGLLLFLDPARREDHPRIVTQLEQQWQKIGIPAHWAGVPWFSKTLTAAITRDLTRVVTLLVVAALGVLIFYFKNFMLVGITLLAMGLALAFSLGIGLMLGARITLFTLILFPLVFCVVLTTVIHLYSLRNKDGTYHFATAFAYILKPATFATVTTALGSAAFLFSPQEAVRQMGWILPLGILIAFVAAMVFVPSAYRMVSGRWDVSGIVVKGGILKADHAAVARPVIGILLMVCAVGSAFVLPRLKSDANALHFFKPESELMRGYRHIEEHLGGLLHVELLIQSTTPSGLTDPVWMAQIQAFLTQVRQWPDLSAMAGGTDLSNMTDPAIKKRFFDASGTRMRVTLGFSQRTDYAELSQRLEHLWHRVVSVTAPVSLRLTGQLPMILAAQKQLLDSQVQTFAVVFFLVSLFLALSLRSLRVFILAVLANFIPLMITGALMVFMGIAINSMNFFVASVMLGVIVDDTIHLLHALAEERDLETGLARVHAALWITTVTVFLAFLTLTISNIVPIAQFGLLSAITVVVAWLCDLYLLPFLLTCFGGRKT